MNKKQKIFQYNAVFQEEADGGYSVWIPSLPGCCSQGETIDEAKKNITEAIELYLESEKIPGDDSQFTQFFIPITLKYA
jgi:predicted RNase H-like HicB family nuclease